MIADDEIGEGIQVSSQTMTLTSVLLRRISAVAVRTEEISIRRPVDNEPLAELGQQGRLLFKVSSVRSGVNLNSVCRPAHLTLRG